MRKVSLISILFVVQALTSAAVAEEQSKEWGDVSESKPQLESRVDWERKTQGENLALGKEVWFSRTPNWRYTVREDDPFKLTTGKLSERQDDRLLYAPDAVGWRDTGPIMMLIDLEESKPVGRVAVRFIGGGEYPMFLFPKEIEVIASDDGKTFYRVSRRTKLLPGEKDLADDLHTYYLAEDGKTYMHTFTFDVDVKAKVIGLNVQPPGTFLVTDQIALIKGEESEARTIQQISQASRFDVIIDNLAFIPRKEDLVITTNMVTPTWLDRVDHRPDGARKPFAELILDLPKGLAVLEGSIGKVNPAVENEDGTIRWKVTNLDVRRQRNGMTGYGPFYIQVVDPSLLSDQEEVVITTLSEGEETYSTRAPLRFVEVPEVGLYEDIHISLAWMTEAYSMGWPGFLDTYAKLGFNAYPVFPRQYGKDRTSDSYYREYPDEQKLAFIEKARESGLDILYNESPFHYLTWFHRQSNPEMMNQLGDKPGRHLSPVYRGEMYHGEIERVGDMVDLVKPDMIFWDIELWHSSVNEARSTREYRRALAQSGKSETDFLHDLGDETLRDLQEEVYRRAEALGISRPGIGLYNNHVGLPVYGYIYNWDRIFPKYVDFAMPSLYVQGNVARVRDTIRRNYESIGARKIIPWLTAGTYGEFDAYLMEPMIIEAFLNGVKGITYYSHFDFDPEDYYYHAKALALLHPYQSLFLSGAPFSIETSNPHISISGFRNAEEALVMLGNYQSTRVASSNVEVPLDGDVVVYDVVTGTKIDPESLTELDVEGQGFRLLHFKKK